MAGLTAAFALIKEGISNIVILDENKQGFEGPWDSYARMATLRSGKTLAGPALGIPALTYQRWHRTLFGEASWEALYKISTPLWMEYLRWYRKVLQLPVQNKARVKTIERENDLLKVLLRNGETLLARKVVLATGRGGFGGVKLPSFLEKIPKQFYAHSWEEIDFTKWKGKEVAVLGAGASAFDASAAALEAGAKSVTQLVQREEIPYINKFASAIYPGFSEGFYKLPDEAKVKMMSHVFAVGGPPPFESLDRVKKFSNFQVVTHTKIESIAAKESLEINGRPFDFLVAATGFAIDGTKQQEIASLFPKIALWSDKLQNLPPEVGAFPYLSETLQFTEKKKGTAPELQNLYCFNYAALLSHGLVSGDIPDISIGATRLAKGIVSDFFTEEWPLYYKRLQEFVKPEFLSENYPFIQ